MKKDLTSKIAGYSGLATSVLLFIQTTKAQVIYTNPADIRLRSSDDTSAVIDVNMDGIMDFKFIAEDFSITTRVMLETGEPLHIIQRPHVLAKFMYYSEPCEDLYATVAFPLVAGKSISPANGEWYIVDPPIIGQVYLGIFSGGSECIYSWAGKKDRYLGFRFHASSNDYNYGWMRLSVSHELANVVIKDWAYESTPNTGITAGSTFRMTDEFLQNGATEMVVSQNGNNLVITKNTEEKVIITIYNSVGQLINQFIMHELSIKMDVSGFNIGTYIVTMTASSKTIATKVFLGNN